MHCRLKVSGRWPTNRIDQDAGRSESAVTGSTALWGASPKVKLHGVLESWSASVGTALSRYIAVSLLWIMQACTQRITAAWAGWKTTVL